ncbi:membrane-bound neuregulin protein vein [Lycorma delicatula]|uniref:membrane-bound neuregulin protein vein n=1 Tax=Lycorma delicatula TaxID=130591 RepID=UPI003F51431A
MTERVSGCEWRGTGRSSYLSPASAVFLLCLVCSGGWRALWTSQYNSVLVSSYELSRTIRVRAQDNYSEWYSDALRKSRRKEEDSEYIRPPAPLRRISRTTPRRAPRGGGFSSSSLRPKNAGKQPCSHVGDLTNQVAARAYLADTVFEGKARSRSIVRDPGGTYAVTFVVQHVHKDSSPAALRIRSQVRLRFKEKVGPEPPGTPCIQSYNYTRRPGELVRTNIKRGGKYLVFVSGVGPHNFSVLGEPVFRSRKNLQAVREVLCHGCVRPVGVWGLEDVKIKERSRLRLVCRCKGNPLPAIQWYKDGARVNVSNNTRIQYKKKRSLLVIPRVRTSDAGRYECQATSITGAVFSSIATVTISPNPATPITDNITTLWPLLGSKCSSEYDSFCLNGGTCTFYETVGEMVCQCAEGFKGQRCDNKDVYNPSSMYSPMTYFCKLGISSSYYC